MRHKSVCAILMLVAALVVAQEKSAPEKPDQDKPTDKPAPAKPAEDPAAQKAGDKAPAKPVAPGIALTAESLRLDEGKLLPAHRIPLARLRSGDVEFSMDEQERRKLLEQVARFYAYRLTHENPMYTTPNALREHMDQLAKTVLPFARALELSEDIPPEQTRRVRQYASELARAFVPALLRVLQDPRPIVRINAMRMAYLFAERGIGEIYPVLLYPLEKYPIDASAAHQSERYWAIRGFGELFHAVASNRDPKRIILPPEIVTRAATLIERWLTWAYHLDPALTKTWPPEEQAGWQSFRRAGLRALAHLRRPLLDPANPKTGRVAEIFLQVMKADPAAKFSPQPSLAEQVEAAAGLLALLPDAKGPYQSDYAFHEVGRFVAELITQANADTEGRQPWQFYAALLRARLLEVQSHPAYAKQPYVQKLLPLMIKPLDELTRARDLSKPIDINPLLKFLDNQPPKVTELYVFAPAQP
jgi:hypothetical protein